ETSKLDIGLEDDCDTITYLQLLHKHLHTILETFQPDFAFYLSGVDVLDTDKFGKLKVSIDGCKQRDEYVFSQLKKRNIPVTVAMGGGYSPDIKIIVEAHCNTFRTALQLYN
ncbi:MAG: histone deacetylase, partial [Chitinophagaceae bacterium]